MEEQRKEIFRFLDLPSELRLMVYEKLANNCVNVIGPDKNFGIFMSGSAFVFETLHPQVLRINKQINSEYSAFTFRDSCLSITYAINEAAFYRLLDKENDPGLWFPRISDFVAVPSSALQKIPFLMVEYEPFEELPESDPARGLAPRITEMPGLKQFTFWTRINHSLVDAGFGLTTGLFGSLVEHIEKMSLELSDFMDENVIEFDSPIECLVCCPLYSIHPALGLFDPDCLELGMVPAPGLPRFGYSTFKVHGKFLTTEEDEGQEAFVWYGQNLTFDKVDYCAPSMTCLGTEEPEDE